MIFARALFIGLVVFHACLAPFASAVEVAFLRVYDANGQLVELTPGGLGYAHVAIRFRDKWFHAHPFGGVQLSSDLRAFGEVGTILESPEWDEPLSDVVRALLNRPYDHDFQWGGFSYYCSELVGVLLNVDPQPMSFEGPYWDAYFAARGNPARPQGLGVSPDGLFRELWLRGFRPLTPVHCAEALTL